MCTGLAHQTYRVVSCSTNSITLRLRPKRDVAARSGFPEHIARTTSTLVPGTVQKNNGLVNLVRSTTEVCLYRTYPHIRNRT